MKLLIFSFLLIASSSAIAANSLVRVDCMEGSAGAKVSLNGHYQFTCADYQKKPIYLAAGDYTLTAVKNLTKKYQRVFQKKITLAAQAPQRIRVILPAKTLTAYGKAERKRKQEAAKVAAEARRKRAQIAAAAKAKRQRKLALEKDIADAKAGKPKAMKRLAARYQKGNGVPKDAAKSQQWQRKSVIASLKQKKASLSYFPMTEAFPRALQQKGSGSSEMTLATIALPVAMLFDSTSAPSVTSERSKIQDRIDELETHASRWASPNSMVARAYKLELQD